MCYSDDKKIHICTRCLLHFNYEQYLIQHKAWCSNKVQAGNLIDSLRITGGYSKEIKKRHYLKNIKHFKKIEMELQEMELQEMELQTKNTTSENMSENVSVI